MPRNAGMLKSANGKTKKDPVWSPYRENSFQGITHGGTGGKTKLISRPERGSRAEDETLTN
ncbi:hypothetical protein N7472_008832 [Penicillium cf. griseofulvum]|uniref:Uncharacterized protein n=1 Tax=Penicillium cf. griseofulvum TaxID=2972120 RepID=A0A9W9M5P0_9EURO|nr:hypothetical protein N7472_008832 [Penicillium cf. griseofulvum]